MLDGYQFLETSDLPPIKLTESYQSFENSIHQTAEILEESTTRDGVKLSRDMNQWVEEFSSKPEPAKGQIVGCSATPQEEELNDLRQQFNSIINRVRKVANQ